MKAERQKSLHFPILIEQDEDGVFIVSCPSFKGCHSYGKTVEEGLAITAMNNGNLGTFSIINRYRCMSITDGEKLSLKLMTTEITGRKIKSNLARIFTEWWWLVKQKQVG